MSSGEPLHVVDLIVFCFATFISLATGVYIAFKERKHSSPFRFHRGDGKLRTLPVAISMVVTFESSVFYLGYPSEVYFHGFIFLIRLIGLLMGYCMLFFITIPLFYPLQITSVNEYLEMRHNSVLVRQVAMWLGTLGNILYVGVVMFGTSLAIQSITGVQSWIFTVAMTTVAVVYTSFGGIKAVVLTDVVQGVVMIAFLVIVLVYGCISVGGFWKVIEVNKHTGRLHMFDFDPSPYARHTFWTLVIGYGWICFGDVFWAPVIQRLNSTKSIKEARKVAAIFITSVVILEALVMFEGLVAYAFFSMKGCDPLAAGKIENPNQIIPYLVRDMFRDIPGITGLFLAALCSASLSTISSVLSSVAAVTSEDLVRRILKGKSERTLLNISKVIVVLTGCACIGVSLLISNIKGPISEILNIVLGAADGPLCAIFCLSIFAKFTTKKGLLVSTVVGICFGLWLSLGDNFSPTKKRTPWLPLGPTEKCFHLNSTHNLTNYDPIGNSTEYLNSTTVFSSPDTEDDSIKGLDYLYSLSYAYYRLIVSIVAILAGIIGSKLTWRDRPSVIPEHLMMGLNTRFFKCIPNYASLLVEERKSKGNEEENDQTESQLL